MYESFTFHVWVEREILSSPTCRNTRLFIIIIHAYVSLSLWSLSINWFIDYIIKHSSKSRGADEVLNFRPLDDEGLWEGRMDGRSPDADNLKVEQWILFLCACAVIMQQVPSTFRFTLLRFATLITTYICTSNAKLSQPEHSPSSVYFSLTDSLLTLSGQASFNLRQISPEYPNAPANICHRPHQSLDYPEGVNYPDYPGKGSPEIVNFKSCEIYHSSSDITQTSHLGWELLWTLLCIRASHLVFYFRSIISDVGDVDIPLIHLGDDNITILRKMVA